MKYPDCINDVNRRYYKSMDSLNRKLSNLEKLRRYLINIIPDIYDQTISSMVQQSSIYRRYTGLCYCILKESVIAENGFREFRKIQSDSERKLSMPNPDEFCEISHDTLERISSGLNEESMIFFTSFYKKVHGRSNMSFEIELFAYSMLFWILRGKKKPVAPKKSRRIAFMFAIAPNILPYIYRWLHKRMLAPSDIVTIHNPRMEMLFTLIDNDIDDLKSGDDIGLLAFLERKEVIKKLGGCKDKYIIVSGRGSLRELFDAFSLYAEDIRKSGTMFPHKDILFSRIVKNENLERFTPGTINKMYSEAQDIKWLLYNLPINQAI